MSLRTLAATLLVLALGLNLLWVALNVDELRDYGSFIGAGKAASRGDNPYGVYDDTYRTTFEGDAIELPNLNPPISIIAFEALAKIDAGAGKSIVVAISATLYAAVLFCLARRYPDKRTPLLLLWALSLAGFWHTLELGQVYIPLLAALTAGWLLQERQPLLAGVLFGLVIAMKPNFALLPLLLLLAGERRTSLGALATAACLSAVPLALDGISIYQRWLEASGAFAGLQMPGNSSLMAIFARAGAQEAGIALSALLVFALVIAARRTDADREQLVAAGVAGALLLGPITWSGYTLFALPVLVARRWQGWEVATAALLAAPVPVVLLLMPLTGVTSFFIGPLYGWGLLILTARIGRDLIRQPPRGSLQPPYATDGRETLAA